MNNLHRNNTKHKGITWLMWSPKPSKHSQVQPLSSISWKEWFLISIGRGIWPLMNLQINRGGSCWREKVYFFWWEIANICMLSSKLFCVTINRNKTSSKIIRSKLIWAFLLYMFLGKDIWRIWKEEFFPFI